MADIQATVQLGNFPDGYCWTDPQQFADDLVDLLSITIPSSAVVTVSADAPADTDSIWFRTVGGYLEGIYIYMGGWYRPHPVPASGGERRIFCGPEDGSASGIWSYDGGDGTDPGASPPTLVSGAMWEVDTAFAFKFPVGCGTGSDYGAPGDPITIAEGDTGGEERHVLLEAEMAEHTHILANDTRSTDGPVLGADDYLSWEGDLSGGGSWSYSLRESVAAAVPNIGKVKESGEDTAHNNMPPYVGVYFIKRTARQMYSAT